MARTGNFGGFQFDEEVFAGMMQETDPWVTPIIASGIVQQDSSIMNLIGEKGNVATIPIYKPLDADEDGMGALNNDGLTDNTPVEMCEICHERPGYIVHHKTELAPENINDPNIALNFDNLKYDCLTCHNKENGRGAKEAEGLVRYVFDEEGNMIPVGADSPKNERMFEISLTVGPTPNNTQEFAKGVWYMYTDEERESHCRCHLRDRAQDNGAAEVHGSLAHGSP